MTVDERERLVRAAREGFLSGDRPDARLRPEIASSWRRSRLSRVAPSDDSVPYAPLLDGANRLLTAAATPVLDWLADQLTGGTAVILADADARILDRRADGRTLSRHLDTVLCVPGSQFGEEHIGTNGIGSVLEASGPVRIAGAEHYRDNLQGFTCVGTPLRHPVHRRLMGVLDVCCRYDDTNDLMTPLMLSAAREIESRMYAESSLRERMLLEEFLKASRRTSAAVVTLNQDFLITTTAAATLLDPSDHALLWEWASDAMTRRGECAGDVRLHGGAVVSARARMVPDAGVLIELRGDRAGSPHRRPATSDPELPGRSAAWRRALAEVGAATRSGLDVLVTGEPGTGKTRVAARILPGAAVFDAALAAVSPTWTAELQDALRRGPVILRHLDALPADLAPVVAALLGTSRVVATASDPAARLFDQFGARIELPPLRQRPEDLPDVAAALLRTPSPAPRLQPAALQALQAYGWPGNVRELGAVLASARLRALGGDIGLAHLPAEHRRAASPSLPTLRRTERETILEALRDARGNKLAAAERLGIARSTLYRKMRALGIEDTRFAPVRGK